MIKLQAATCPQCGASIEVNENLEKTICQFCGTTILVSDAVEKYKVELSGSVKVEGIKNRDDHLSQAEKHFKVEEYNQARTSLKNILSEDTFDIDAYVMLIKCNIMLIRKNNYNPYCSVKSNNFNKLYQECFTETLEVYERLQKIDESKSYETTLSEFKKDIDNYYNIKEDIEKGKELAKEFFSVLKTHYNYMRSCSANLFDKYLDILSECFNWYGKNFSVMHGVNNDRKDRYVINQLTDLTFDGIVSATYNISYIDIAYDENLLSIEKNLQCEKSIQNYEDLEKTYNLYIEKGKPLYDKELKKDSTTQLIVNIFKGIGCLIALIILFKLLRIF